MNLIADLESLRGEYIQSKTAEIYLNSIVKFFMYLLEGRLGEQLRDPTTPTLRRFAAENRQNLKVKLKQELKKNPIPDFLDFEILTERHFMGFVLSLNVNGGGMPSLSTYGVNRAAFNHLYTIFRKKKPEELDAELSLYYRGLKKRGARRAQSGQGPMHRSKQPLPFPVYKLLAKHLLQATGIENNNNCTQFIFGHLYLLLCWNTMSRSINTATIAINHIEWENDALKVYIFHQKNDQDGDKAEHAKHIYANPVNPEICPILSLGTSEFI